MIKVFFEDVGCLDNFNFGLSTSLALNRELSISVGASTLHTFKKAWRFSRVIRNMNSVLMVPPGYKAAQTLAVKRLPQLYRRFLGKFDLLHLNELSSPYSKISLYQVTKPKILTLHDHPIVNDYIITEKKGASEVNELMNSISRVEKVGVSTEYFAKLIEERLGFKPIVIHHGVNSSLFNTSIPKDYARKVLGISEDQKVIIWNSRMNLQKDPRALFDALPLIAKAVPSVLFLIIGRPAADEQRTCFMKNILLYANKKIEQAGISQNVRFLTKHYIPQEQLPLYYRSGDMLVHTSRLESFGNVLVEAMACKLPVVATNASCMPEIVGDGGLFFEPGESKDLAEKLFRVLTDKNLSVRLGEKALQRVSNNFTWSATAKGYLKLYKSLA